MPRAKLLIILLAAVFLLIIQAAWIFLDSRERGERYYWLWGLFGLINFPQSLIVYLVVTRIIMGNKKAKK